MGWVVILLLVVMYVYAVLGVTSFALIDPMHFRDLHTSFLTAAKCANERLEDVFVDDHVRVRAFRIHRG